MIDQLIFIRHGETLHNAAGIAQGWQDSALSEKGQAQVRRMARRLVAYGVNALYSSPLPRALTTAQAISDETGLEIQILDDLREMNYGGWEGKNFLEVRTSDPESYGRWISEDDFRCPDGESHADVLARVKRAIAVAINGSGPAGMERASKRRAVLVSHGTAIRIGATALLDLPLAAARNFAQDNAAINQFLWRAGRFVLKVWNDNRHCSEP